MDLLTLERGAIADAVDLEVLLETLVDAVDRVLSGLYAEFRSTLREIALSPAHKVDNEEHIVVPLLAAQLENKSGNPG